MSDSASRCTSLALACRPRRPLVPELPRRILVMIALAVALVGQTGCVGEKLRDEIVELKELIHQARRNGAKHCAPKALARGEVSLERAEDELERGRYIAGKRFYARAERNIKQALRDSPPEECVGGRRKSTDGDRDQDGIPDKRDRCPDQPEDRDGFQDEDGCPDPDNDGDRIPDSSDDCPSEPEDFDGFEDEDGCPDLDNDKDKILDVDDQCPNQPEDYDGDKDDDGCPDKYKLVVVTRTKIELRQKVYFATAKTKIRERSFPLLREVAQVLQDSPKMQVRIEGHTDSRGSDAYNLRLSEGRAASVKTFLIGQGIAPERLQAVGFGEGRPIADNRTRSGRALNRRVEFFIIKR
jgi:OOP family OmpA-OmpF porin